MKGKTTHEMARELLALPDVPLGIELWCEMEDHEMVAKMTEYDPEGRAIICQKPLPGYKSPFDEGCFSAYWSYPHRFSMPANP